MRCSRRSVYRRDRLVNVGRVQVQPEAERVCRRDGHRHGVCRTLQPCRRNRPLHASHDHPEAGRFVLGSSTRPAGSAAQNGLGATLGYNYNTRIDVGKRVGRALRPHIPDGHGVHQPRGHHERLGLCRSQLLSRQGRFEWVRRISPFIFTQGGWTASPAGGTSSKVGVRFDFTRLGFLRVYCTWGFEPWAGDRFPRGMFRTWGNVQLYRWLKLDGRFESGQAVYYYPENPFSGHKRRVNGGFVLQPNGRFSEQISFDQVTFDRQATGERVYQVNIINTKTTYQFTREFFRARDRSVRQLAQSRADRQSAVV